MQQEAVEESEQARKWLAEESAAKAQESAQLRERLIKVEAEAAQANTMLAEAQQDSRNMSSQCKELLAEVEAKAEESARWREDLTRAESNCKAAQEAAECAKKQLTEEAQKNMDLLAEAMRVEAEVRQEAREATHQAEVAWAEAARWRTQISEAESEVAQKHVLLCQREGELAEWVRQAEADRDRIEEQHQLKVEEVRSAGLANLRGYP